MSVWPVSVRLLDASGFRRLSSASRLSVSVSFFRSYCHSLDLLKVADYPNLACLMLDEIRKRPFMRPLFLWIAGILLYTSCPSPRVALACLFFPVALLIAAGLASSGTRRPFSLRPETGKSYLYARRGMWGALFASLLISLAMLATAIRTAYPPGDTTSRLLSRPSGSVLPFSTEALRLQTALADRFDRLRLSDEEKSVLATLTLGYRRAMKRGVRDRFSVAGVSHILAVSGFHVAVVAGFATFFLGWLPRRGKAGSIRWLLTVAAVWSYVWLTGAAPSAIRAGVMITLFLTGRLLRRRTDRYNTWAAAAFCMLAYQPLYLFDIGFQLSYAAVFGILYFQPRLKKCLPEVRNPLLAYPWEGLTVTMAAQAGTLWLSLYYFGRFPLFFLFTNLPVALLATWLIPLGLLWVGLPAACPGYGWLQITVETCTRWLVGVVDGFGRIPGAAYPLSVDGFSLFCLYGTLLFAIGYARSRRPWLLFAALAFLLIMLIGRLIEWFLLSGI